MDPVNYEALTREERAQVREAYVTAQEGKCAHCKELLTELPAADVCNRWINRDLFPEGFLRYPVHLHHDHNTGLTIGAVHAKCNAVLWQYFGE